MKTHYLGIDYRIHPVDFPHMGIRGAISWNSDSTAEIYLNTLYNKESVDKTLRHELRHMVYGHRWCEHKDHVLMEAEADNDDDENVIFAEDYSWVCILHEFYLLVS